jgi:hypothetical protein
MMSDDSESKPGVGSAHGRGDASAARAGAFPMFDAWSARAPMKYDRATCIKKWDEAAKVAGFTMATAVFLANQYDI